MVDKKENDTKLWIIKCKYDSERKINTLQILFIVSWLSNGVACGLHQAENYLSTLTTNVQLLIGLWSSGDMQILVHPKSG